MLIVDTAGRRFHGMAGYHAARIALSDLERKGST